MAPPRRFTPADDARLVKLWPDHTVPDLVWIFQVAPTTLRNAATRLGLVCHGQGIVTPADEAHLVRCWADDDTVEAIAADLQYRVTARHLLRLARRLELPPRSRGHHRTGRSATSRTRKPVLPLAVSQTRGQAHRPLDELLTVSNPARRCPDCFGVYGGETCPYPHTYRRAA